MADKRRQDLGKADKPSNTGKKICEGKAGNNERHGRTRPREERDNPFNKGKQEGTWKTLGDKASKGKLERDIERQRGASP